MRRFVTMSAAAATAALLGACLTAAVPASASTSECAPYAARGVDVAACTADLAAARTATSRYTSTLTASLAGYVRFTGCESSPAGAMGEHWARLDRMVVPSLKPAAPAILLYLPTTTGRRLVGVEYEETALVDGLPYYGSTAPDPAHVSPRPTMFGGMPFDGPMHGHNAIQPWHYDLHVWLWATNPTGVFEQWNPSLHC